MIKKYFVSVAHGGKGSFGNANGFLNWDGEEGPEMLNYFKGSFESDGITNVVVLFYKEIQSESSGFREWLARK